MRQFFESNATMQSGRDNIYKKYVYLDVGQYTSLSKDYLLENNLEGVFTEDVCDCVFGYLISENHIFSFHFYRANDPDHLLNEILKFFSPGGHLKIFLITGGFNDLAYPWNLAKRNLSLDNIPISTQNDIDLMKEIISQFNSSDGFDTSIIDFDYNDLMEKCVVGYKNDFFKIDFNLIDKEIKSKNFKVESGDNIIKFNMKNALDFVGIQNLNKIYYILQELKNHKISFVLDQYFAAPGSSFITSSNFSDPIVNQVRIIENIPNNTITNISQYLKYTDNYYFKSEGNVKSEKFLFYKQKKLVSEDIIGQKHERSGPISASCLD